MLQVRSTGVDLLLELCADGILLLLLHDASLGLALALGESALGTVHRGLDGVLGVEGTEQLLLDASLLHRSRRCGHCRGNVLHVDEHASIHLEQIGELHIFLNWTLILVEVVLKQTCGKTPENT